MGFLSQWKMYLDELSQQTGRGVPFSGRKMDPTAFEKASLVIVSHVLVNSTLLSTDVGRTVRATSRAYACY
jgi:hypothetical protein